MTPEGRVKNDIKKYLEAIGFQRAGGPIPDTYSHRWYYMPIQNGMGVSGIPDFICCDNGVFLGIEAKAPKKRPTDNQVERHKEIASARGVVIVADDVALVKEYFGG
jgi:hypothetical protein